MEPIEETYFSWLVAKILYVENPTPSLRYDNLLRILHNEEFAWHLKGDDNRARDGVDLRTEFLFASRYDPPPGWLEVPCSVLEMMIAFGRRAEHMTDIPSPEWFWQMIQNLGLRDFTDAVVIDPAVITEILYIFNWRQYDYKGTGGLWPIDDPGRDQREVEVWYQFCDYLIANGR